MNPAKVAELIEMMFGDGSHVSPKNHILDGDEDWRHLQILLINICVAMMRPYVKLH